MQAHYFYMRFFTYVWYVCSIMAAWEGDEQLQLSEFLERLFAAAGGEGHRKRPRMAPDKNPQLGVSGALIYSG